MIRKRVRRKRERVDDRKNEYDIDYEDRKRGALSRFRFLLGIVECIQILRMFHYETIDDNFSNPTFHFKYYGFEWVPVLKLPYLYFQYIMSAIMCLVFASGKARVTGSTMFFVSQTWFFLSDRALYNNHYYLAALLSSLFLCIDIHQYYWGCSSVKKNPCSHAYLFLFQMQIGIVYVVEYLIHLLRVLTRHNSNATLEHRYAFATFAKLSSQDWLKAYPARIWLQDAFRDAVRDVYGPQWIVRENHPVPVYMAYVMSYGGILVDGFLAYMCITVALLYREQRNLLSFPGPDSSYSAIVMFVLWTSFHVSNFLLFDIGIFPMMMLSCLCLFYDTKRSNGRVEKRPLAVTLSSRYSRMLTCLYFTLQILIPLRFLFYSSHGRHVNWTGHGEMFSWRMMLTSKRCLGHFHVLDSTGSITIIRDPEDFGLNQMQWWRMISDVEHVRQMAHHLRNNNEISYHDVISVNAFINCSLNGAASQPFLNTSVDFSVLKASESYSQVLQQTHFL